MKQRNRETHPTENAKDRWLIRLLVAVIFVATDMLSLSISAPESAAGGLPHVAPIEVEVRDGRLSLRASDAPIDEVIRSIGAQAGFETVVYGTPKVHVNRSISDMPLVMAVQQLLKGVSNSMHFEESSSPRLIQVTLYATAEADSESEVPAAATGTVVTRNLDNARIDEIDQLRNRAGTGDAEAVMQLTALLHDDSDPVVRGRAAAILGEIGDTAAVAVLQAGTRDAEQLVRMRSIRALATIRNDQSIQVLADLLFNHADSRTRLLAVWALGRQATPLARLYLESAHDKADPQLQSAITRALDSGSDDVEP